MYVLLAVLGCWSATANTAEFSVVASTAELESDAELFARGIDATVRGAFADIEDRHRQVSVRYPLPGKPSANDGQ